MNSEESAKEIADPCRSRPDFSRVSCGMAKGHVQSETDWHQGKTTVTTFEQGSFHTIKHETTEVIRWAPHSFEVPRQPKAEPED